MLRLSRYFKPYVGMLLLAVVLLFVQANAELALPDYMSQIVNVGIQQGGVDTAVAEALRKDTMEHLLLFMSEEEAAKVLDAYSLEEVTAENNLAGRYPTATGHEIYVRDELASDETAQLEPIMSKAFMVVGGIESGGTAGSSVGPMAGFDLSKLPPGASPFDMLKMAPASKREVMLEEMTAKFAAMGPDMLVQAAARFVTAEYDALGMDTGRLRHQYILRTGGWMMLLTLLSAVSTVIVGFLSARIAAGFGRDLRDRVFQTVESFSNAELDKFSTASLITRSTNDIMQIQMVSVMLIRMVFYAPIIGVGGIIRAIGKSSSMWWIIAAAVGALSVLVLIVYKVAVPKFKLIQKLMDRLNLVSREGLSGMMVIRAFNMQSHEEKRFDEANEELTSTMLFVNRVMVIMMPFMMLIMNGLSVLIIWVGSHEIAASSMQVGDMMAFLQYSMQIVMSFLMLSMMFIMLPRAAVSADRVADVLETDSSIKDPEKPESYRENEFDGTVEFERVSFRYGAAEEDVIHDISFTARPGETTAFIGATGSGKSTVVNLVPRFYDVTEGTIRVGGVDVRNVSQHDLRDKIGYIPQKATLFSGTIAENLRYADDNATEELLSESVSIAQAEEMVQTRENGMDAELSQGGINLSGGQKQRLSIARALVKRPPIFIFDDSFSALDFATDARLRRALKEKTGESTVIIVTQRVSTIKNAEQIIVLDEGRIVGQGTHHELMENCETYREIATSQLTLEELA